MTGWTCDVCNEPIEDVEFGMVKYRHFSYRTDRAKPDCYFDVVVCHKGNCDNQEDGCISWLELATLEEYPDRHWLRDALLHGEREEIHRDANGEMVRFRYAGAVYVLSPEDIVSNLPSDVLACGLKQGKALLRAQRQGQREERVHRSAQRVRDEQLMGVSV